MGIDSAYSSATSGAGCSSASAAVWSTLPVLASSSGWSVLMTRFLPAVVPGQTPVSVVRTVGVVPGHRDAAVGGFGAVGVVAGVVAGAACCRATFLS